ncbi:MAG: hypothetical protein M0R21_10435 [Lentimicrobiaceae bacterium]|nr:hypothetical protein [Lentimicrobiaceae bacterium]
MKKGSNTNILRNYKMSDAELWRKSMNITVSLKIHLAEFRKFDPSINETFIAELEELTMKKGAEELTLFTNVDASRKIETQNLNAMLVEGRSLYQGVKYYFKKTFPGQKGIWNEFGANDYLKCRSSQPLMERFLKQMAVAMQKYLPQLKAKGMQESLLNEVSALASKIGEGNDKQELKKKERPAITQFHIENNNKLYDKLIQLSEVARYIFYNDKQTRDRFKVYKGIRRKKRKKKTETPENNTDSQV